MAVWLPIQAILGISLALSAQSALEHGLSDVKSVAESWESKPVVDIIFQQGACPSGYQSFVYKTEADYEITADNMNKNFVAHQFPGTDDYCAHNADARGHCVRALARLPRTLPTRRRPLPGGLRNMQGRWCGRHPLASLHASEPRIRQGRRQQRQLRIQLQHE